ncbi:MAG: glycosyltransferase family 4 protein [Verrucomicrobiota bacterium]|nr:glycosyltransferase family 4 protein [Verrucomicrobiota bacterium]
MRVIHVITRLIVGGAQENTIASVLGLQRKPGLEVELISGPSIGPEGSLESDFKKKSSALTIIPSLIRPVDPQNDFQAFQQLTKHFQTARPDIVHTHSSKAGILGRLAAHRAKVPIIIHTIHGPSFGSFQGIFANRIFLFAERYAAKVTTHFISVADAMTEQYLAAGIGRPEQFTRIVSGFALSPFLEAKNNLEQRAPLGIAPDDFVIGKIARLFELKGHDDLLAIAPRLVEKCPQIKFLLVGDGAWRSRFENRSRQLGLEKHFIFAGLVRPSEMPNYIGIMDMLIHLSRREGLPRALPQALAAAKPVVAYNCDGAREICLENETGFLIPTGDLTALTEKILQLISDKSLRERLGRRGQILVQENFFEEKMVDDLHALYCKLYTLK